jgi:hypothetical protein
MEEEDKRDAESAEIEWLRDEGKRVASIGWGDSNQQGDTTVPERSLTIVKGNGFFRAHFSAAVGELNNTKSVGSTLERDLAREVYRFLKRTVPIKCLDFLGVAKENGLMNHQTSYRPSIPGSFNHRVSFGSKQAGETETGRIFWVFTSMRI